MCELSCYSSVVIIGFEQEMYTAEEMMGFVDVCTVLIGQIERQVNVTLRTMENTAQGKYKSFTMGFCRVYENGSLSAVACKVQLH